MEVISLVSYNLAKKEEYTVKATNLLSLNADGMFLSKKATAQSNARSNAYFKQRRLLDATIGRWRRLLEAQ